MYSLRPRKVINYKEQDTRLSMRQHAVSKPKPKTNEFHSTLGRCIINGLKFKVTGPPDFRSNIQISKSLYESFKDDGINSKWKPRFDLLLNNQIYTSRYNSKGEGFKIKENSFCVKVLRKKPISFFNQNLNMVKTNEMYFFCLKFFKKRSKL